MLELVDGQTLADRIAAGPIPVGEVLPIARQIAAAHEHGVIHRDLKPGNIKLRPDGTVKVLDFGLAKLTDPNVSDTAYAPNALSLSPTITNVSMMTGVGLLIGTAAYMAPEQAKGRAVDKRADIFAFGCVLYEMLTGRRTFAGEDVSDTLAFVLTKDADWNELPASTPQPIRKLLRRCLEKDRKRRLADIADAPDGRRVAFIATGSGGSPSLWVRSFDALDAQVLAGTENASLPFWSPDSRTIGFFANGKVKTVSPTGGPVQSLCDAPGGRGGAWSSDGVIIFSPNNAGGLLRVSAAGGQPVPRRNM